MEFSQVIPKRRSIRAYENRAIDSAVLNEILNAGLWAPSGVNLQPWYFVAIQSVDRRKALAEMMETVSQRIRPGLEKRFAKHPAVVDETTRFIRQMGGAPVCVLVFELKPDYENTAGIVTLSIAAAIENVLLAAADKGLGGCWLTAPVEAEVGDALRDRFAPGKGKLVSMLTLGYPAQEPKAPPRKDGRYIII